MANTAHRFANCRLDLSRRELFVDERAVALEPRVFDLLRYLIDHRERAVSKDELQDTVWGTIVTDAALTRAVMKLRKAVGDSRDGRIIRTVSGHGYRFVAELADASGSHADDVDTRPSIAVLPLANMSGADDDYFGDGVAEEILNLLARLPALRVASRTSSFAFKERQVDVRAIGETLSVDFVLEGSVRRAGNAVRITAQLIDARSDAHLWSETYDRQLTDIFAVQAEIAGRIVDALDARLGPDIRRYDATRSPRAYDYYLRGLQLFHATDMGQMALARSMFEKAIAVDPDYALAWAGLANAASWLQMWMEQSSDIRALADSASARALEIAPERAEAHAARGFALNVNGRFDEAAQAFEAALALDATLYEAWYLFGRSRFAEGDPQGAATLFARAAEVRPDEYQAAALQEMCFRTLGEEASARTSAARARRRVENHLELYPDDTRALYLGAACCVTVGDRDTAYAWCERALAIGADDVMVLHGVGCVYAFAGDVERALDVFEKRLALGMMYRDWIDKDPDFDSIRDHPRFIAMLEAAERRAGTGKQEDPT